MNNKSLFGSIKEFLKFSMVGIVNTIISLLVFNLLIHFGIHYLFATVLGYMAGLVNGYIMSSKYVFQKEKTISTASKFVLVYLSALGINLILMYIFVDIIGINSSIAQFIMSFLNVAYNFTVNKLWTFSNR